jgi:rRNA maturation RNase YbeY
MPLEINNLTKKKVDGRGFSRLGAMFFKKYRCPLSTVSLALVGDRRMRTLNKVCLKKDYSTDVLAFPGGEEKFLGEIIINLDQVKRQAKDYSPSFTAELKHVFVHGLYHLLGYTDYTKKDRERMEKLTNGFLEGVKK